MGDDRRDCYERECFRDKCVDDCCDSGGSGNIIWILIILYLLFCNNGCDGRRGGGLFGGLF